MTEWKEYKLGEIVAFGNGKERPKAKGHVPVYGGNGILDYTSEYNYDGETVIIGRVGAYCGSVYYADCPIWVSDNALAVKAKDNNSPKFLYYFLRNLKLNDYAEGSSHPLVTQRLLNSIDVRFPNDVKEQKTIAAILSSLDDKIDLLHRENATLEQMAETLFRQWFVEEAKDEWEEGKLGDWVELVNGVSYKGDELQPSNVAMVTLKSFDRNGGFRMDGYKEFTGKFKKEQVLYDGDLVVAHTDITQEADVIGNPVIVIGKNQYETITFSMDVVKVVSKSEFFSNSFLYYLMKTQAFKEHCLGYANGSTVLHLSKKAIPEFEFHIPPKIIAQSFQKQVESINKKILNNNNEIQTLIQTCDGLLPKLMSNEITIR